MASSATQWAACRSSSSSPRIPPRRRGAGSCARTAGSRRCCASSTTPSCRRAPAHARSAIWRRRSPCCGRPTRFVRSGRALSTRSATASGSSRRACGRPLRASSPSCKSCREPRRPSARRSASARGSEATSTATRTRAPRRSKRLWNRRGRSPWRCWRAMCVSSRAPGESPPSSWTSTLQSAPWATCRTRTTRTSRTGGG